MSKKFEPQREYLQSVRTVTPVFAFQQTLTRFENDGGDYKPMKGLKIYRVPGSKHVFLEKDGKTVEVYAAAISQIIPL